MWLLFIWAQVLHSLARVITGYSACCDSHFKVSGWTTISNQELSITLGQGNGSKCDQNDITVTRNHNNNKRLRWTCCWTAHATWAAFACRGRQRPRRSLVTHVQNSSQGIRFPRRVGKCWLLILRGWLHRVFCRYSRLRRWPSCDRDQASFVAWSNAIFPCDGRRLYWLADYRPLFRSQFLCQHFPPKQWIKNQSSSAGGVTPSVTLAGEPGFGCRQAHGNGPFETCISQRIMLLTQGKSEGEEGWV